MKKHILLATNHVAHKAPIAQTRENTPSPFTDSDIASLANLPHARTDRRY